MFSSNTTQTSGGYEIQRSLRFNSADSAYLNRTPASAGNRQTWTWSGWVKRSALGTDQFILSAGSGSGESALLFSSTDTIVFYDFQSSAYTGRLITTQVFRDVSAWYHLVFVFDTTNSTAGDRMRLYVNGSEVTSFGTDTQPTQNLNGILNGAVAHTLGRFYSSATAQLNGYLTEINFIDGQALTPSSFGEYNADTGVWQPKRYGGSYGTNGFYLNFSDNSNTTAATLGADYSGNGNNWTPNNFSVSAGAGNDSVVDVPTNWGVDTGVGGTVRGNYATLNPLDSIAMTITNGNLDYSGVDGGCAASISPASGKWYWEVTVTDFAFTDSNYYWSIVGVSTGRASSYASGSPGVPQGAGLRMTTRSDGGLYEGATQVEVYGTFANGDIIGIAFDADLMKLEIFRNGTKIGLTLNVPAGAYTPSIFAMGVTGDPSGGTANFGQRPFAYTAPSGFKALNTQNLPTPTIGATPATQAGKFFNPVIYSGDNSSTRTLAGVGFQPDLVWLKTRNLAYGHLLYDAIRGPSTSGASKALSSNSNGAEGSINDDSSYGYLSGFTSDGFSVVKGTQTNTYTNSSGDTYVAWNWKAGDSNVTNTAGSITSTVRANTTSGFSVVTYTGNGAGATVGHGLGVAPKMVIIKSRSAGGSSPSYNWVVYTTVTGSLGYLFLNTTAEINSLGAPGQASPTSSVFSLSTNNYENQNTVTYVAYAFAEVPGYSKFGIYTGNGSSTDGPFVFCGFRPRYVLIKRTDVVESWYIYDTARNTFNALDKFLETNSSAAEATFTFGDYLSNGFKIRNNATGMNGNGGTFIFAAFAEFPFKYSLAR